MTNSTMVYYDAGLKAGLAARYNDIGLLRHWQDWKRRAVYLEVGNDRATAETYWKQGYTAGRNL